MPTSTQPDTAPAWRWAGHSPGTLPNRLHGQGHPVSGRREVSHGAECCMAVLILRAKELALVCFIYMYRHSHHLQGIFCLDTALHIVGSHFLRTRSCLSLPIYCWPVMVGWEEVLGKVIASSGIFPWHNAALCTTLKDAFTVLFFLR